MNTGNTIKLINLVGLFALAGCATTPTDKAADEPMGVVEELPVASDPEKAELRLTLAGVGDMMLGTDYPKNHLPDDDGFSFLQHVTPVLRNVDIAFGNLEGVLLEGGEPAKECSNPSACYLFRSPPRYAEHFAAAGFDVISLANNHARDFGEEGRLSSMEALQRVGIQSSGLHGTAASWEQNGLRIAMIAFSPTKGSWNLLDPELASWAVKGLDRHHDIILVSFHGGAEGFEGAERIGAGMEMAYGEKRGDVKLFAHSVIDAGADIVFGHGPHVPRALELYNDRLIAYSLGNFATYYGINVRGMKGYAPIVLAEIDGTGRFLSGRIDSNIQVRPGGPQPDPQHRAARKIRELTLLDFPDTPLAIDDSGNLTVNPSTD